MFKLLVISTVLILAEAANIENIYGIWVPLISYPEHIHFQPTCVYVLFEESSAVVACPCADRRNTTLVKITSKPAGNSTESPRTANLHVLAVDTFEEVESALAVSCDCDADRGVVRLVSNNYFILYQKNRPNLNDAELFAKNIVSQAELVSDVEAIEEFRGKKGDIWCTSELRALRYKL